MTLSHELKRGAAVLLEAGIADGERDAETLLFAAFHIDLVHFLLNRADQQEETEQLRGCRACYRRMIEERAARIPLQQILGSQEFMGLEFAVNRHVLVPRQDTESLVELVLEEQREKDREVLDLCTGSGCIGISLAVRGAYRLVAGCDLSPEALELARENGKRLAGGRVLFFQGDLFQALPPALQRFDVIVSNPPYIPTAVIDGLEPEVRDHEPRMALDGAGDGLLYYRRIAAEAGAHLRDGGSLYLEIGWDQGAAVSALLEKAGFSEIQVGTDLTGTDRTVRARWKRTGGLHV